MLQDRDWLLRHLADQARYLASLTAWARDNPTEPDVLLRVGDEIFTLRETRRGGARAPWVDRRLTPRRMPAPGLE